MQILRLTVVLIGGVMNIALLSLPMLIVQGVPPQPTFAVIVGLVLCCLFYAADVQTVWNPPQKNILSGGSGKPRCCSSNFAACTALLLLTVLLVSQAEYFIVRYQTAPSSCSMALQACGAGLMLIAAVLRATAVASLGQRFVTRLEADALVAFNNRGIYRYVRHPSESALLMFSLGAAMLMLSVAGAAIATLLLTPLVVWRMRREDLFLCDVYRNTYPQYARRVAALIPGVY